MVKQKEKKQALEYICNLLENTSKYNILGFSKNEKSNKDYKAFRVKDRDTSKIIDIAIPNFFKTANNYTSFMLKHNDSGISLLPIFYKDGKTAFVRMVNNSSWRQDESLKLYQPHQINQMLHLRKIEKETIFRNQPFNYYQPKTERLEESLRVFELENVTLDYSHINRNHPSYGFASGQKDSIDYRLPKEILTLTRPFEIVYNNKFGLKTSIKEFSITDHIGLDQVRNENLATAMEAYPDLDPEEAYHMFYIKPNE